jgi:HPt (histidine-containing phosphotransfer) domain-containing protein
MGKQGSGALNKQIISAAAVPSVEGDADPIPVRVHPVARDLAPKFLDGCRANLARILSDFEQVDLDAVYRMGHQMKGAGGSYGFQEITRFGAAIEQAAKAEDRVQLRGLVEQLADYLRRVKPVYE